MVVLISEWHQSLAGLAAKQWPTTGPGPICPIGNTKETLVQISVSDASLDEGSSSLLMTRQGFEP
jgi:hypothetical protein